jgi:hypothetical protein
MNTRSSPRRAAPTHAYQQATKVIGEAASSFVHGYKLLSTGWWPRAPGESRPLKEAKATSSERCGVGAI